jgi:phage shock protein PspC (stress-responsive transcriptional regulator)
MTQTPHDTAGSGGQGPRVSPAQMRDLNRLHRSTTDRKVAGVAGGIARHLDVDPTIVRVLLVVLVFFGGAGLLIYGAVWLFVPEDGTDEAPVGTSGETRTVVLIVALVLAALLLLSDAWWLGFGGGWPPPVLPLLVVGLVVWLLMRNRNQGAGSPPVPPVPPVPPEGARYSARHGAATGAAVHPPAAGGAQATEPGYGPPPPAPPNAPAYLPPQPRPAPRPRKARSIFGITMAFVLLAMGSVAVIELAGTSLPWAAYPATALTVIGLALLVGAFIGRTTGLGFMGLLAALVLSVAVWAPELRFGEVNAHPVTAASVPSGYDFTAGRIHLDLTDVQDLDQLDGRVLDLSMRAGEVIVELPDGLDVDVVSEADGGRLDVLGQVREGRDITNHRSSPDTTAPDLRINLDLGFGHARVSTP